MRIPNVLPTSLPGVPVLLAGKRRSHQARAVVTGAGSGIGRAFALELARRGGRVVVSDVSEARAQAVVAEIEAAGGEALAVTCDVSDEAQVTELASLAELWFGRAPTLVVNNAGVGIGGSPVGQDRLEDWEWALGINLWGPVHGCRVFAPRLREAGFGGIINVASAAGFAAAPHMAAYNVGKAGVVSLSETLAAELSGTGVHVSVLCPTFVRTNIVTDGRISADASRMATGLMRVSGLSASRVARMALDGHDRGRLYVVPQLDARLIWATKRLVPELYARGAGLLGRLAPAEDASGLEARSARTSTGEGPARTSTSDVGC